MNNEASPSGLSFAQLFAILRARKFTESLNPFVDPLAPRAARAQAQAVPKSPACREDIPWCKADAVFKRFVKQSPGVESFGQLDPQRESASGPTTATLSSSARINRLPSWRSRRSLRFAAVTTSYRDSRDRILVVGFATK